MNINLTNDEADVLRAVVSYLRKEERFTAAMEEADLKVDDDWEALCAVEEKLCKANPKSLARGKVAQILDSHDSSPLTELMVLTALRNFAEKVSKSSEKDYPDGWLIAPEAWIGTAKDILRHLEKDT